MDDATEKKFETLFDGDEIDGKTYGLGELVTGLDAATGAFLVEVGRIAEIGDDRATVLESNAPRKPRAKVEEKEPVKT